MLHPSIDTGLLTNVTRRMAGIAEHNRKDTSIHPRVVNNRTVHPKVNTSKSRKA